MKEPASGVELMAGGGSGPRRNLGGFRTVWLNLYGWSALIVLGLIVGALVGLATPLPMWLALFFGVTETWFVVLMLDRHRHRNSMIHMCRDGWDESLGALVVAQLAEEGISATYEEQRDEDEDGLWVQRGIVCRHADQARVEAMIAEHLPGPEPP